MIVSLQKELDEINTKLDRGGLFEKFEVGTFEYEALQMRTEFVLDLLKRKERIEKEIADFYVYNKRVASILGYA